MPAKLQKLLIVGSGDIASRALPLLAGHYRLYALIRDRAQIPYWRGRGVTPLLADLDRRASLRRLAGLADIVLHLAPPPGEGAGDARTRHLLAALGRRATSLPRTLIYISTTGVYGDCAGARIDETRRVDPQSPRARRRVDAEQQLRAFGRRCGVRVAILRAPGIYAADRLPLARLEAGLPALQADDDVYSNHIHADDLAAACIAALRRAASGRVYNAVDASALKMGDYFDLVADACNRPRPPRLPLAQAKAALTPLQWSFMRESRRIANDRLTRELQCRLRYPSVADGIADAACTLHLERFLSC